MSPKGGKTREWGGERAGRDGKKAWRKRAGREKKMQSRRTSLIDLSRAWGQGILLLCVQLLVIICTIPVEKTALYAYSCLLLAPQKRYYAFYPNLTSLTHLDQNWDLHPQKRCSKSPTSPWRSKGIALVISVIVDIATAADAAKHRTTRTTCTTNTAVDPSAGKIYILSKSVHRRCLRKI